MKKVDFSNPGISFVTGVPITKGVGLLVLSIDELFEKKEAHSILVYKENNIASGVLVPSNCCDVTVVRNNGNIFGYFLGEDGEIWCFDGNSIESMGAINHEAHSSMNRSQTIFSNGQQYVVGGGSAIYYRDNCRDMQSEWQQVEVDMISEIDQYKYVGFEKVIGNEKKHLYLFGWHGLAYLIRNNKIQRIVLPVNVDLYDAVYASDGSVYVCGEKGTVLKGTGLDNWEIIDNEVTNDKLWGVCSYMGRIFVSSMSEIYEVLRGGGVQKVLFSENSVIPSLTYKLKSCEECLWSIGSKQLVEFDGVEWRDNLKLS
ncbi:MAG: hypothetical protein methR_P3557 [Methyloprofundus sp.]|nr:MAG: hypothetical protein methR_P3557 [Methyloprofundus sp.]